VRNTQPVKPMDKNRSLSNVTHLDQQGRCRARKYHAAGSNLKNLELDLPLPGFSINTSRPDYRVVKEFRVMRFNGERWEPFGPIMAVQGRSV
jgi:hypothetical protein